MLTDVQAVSGVTLTEFREVLERDGYSYTKFREDLRKQLLIQQVRRQMVSSRISVNDQEVDNLQATLKASGQGDIEYHLSHILVAIPEAASPDQIQQAGAKYLVITLGQNSGFMNAPNPVYDKFTGRSPQATEGLK